MPLEKIALPSVVGPQELVLLKEQERRIEGLQAYQNGSIMTTEDATRATERLVLVREVAANFEKMRTKLKAPHLENGRRVDTAFKPMLDRCKNIDTSIGAELVRYHQHQRLEAETTHAAAEAVHSEAVTEQASRLLEIKEQATREAQEQGMEAEEAEWWVNMALEQAGERAPAVPAVVAPAPTPAKIETAFGSAGLVKGAWTYQVADVMKLPAGFQRLNPAAFTSAGQWEALGRGDTALLARASSWRPDDEALRWAVKSGARDIPGVRIYQPETLRRGK